MMAGDGFEKNIIWHDENHFSYVAWREKVLRLMESCAAGGRQKWMTSSVIMRMVNEHEPGNGMKDSSLAEYLIRLVESGHVERTRRKVDPKIQLGNPRQYFFRRTKKPYKRRLYDVRIFEERKILTGFRRKNILKIVKNAPRWFVDMMIY